MDAFLPKNFIDKYILFVFIFQKLIWLLKSIINSCQTVGHIQFAKFNHRSSFADLYLCLFEGNFPQIDRSKQTRNSRCFLEVCPDRRASKFVGGIWLLFYGRISHFLLNKKMGKKRRRAKRGNDEEELNEEKRSKLGEQQEPTPKMEDNEKMMEEMEKEEKKKFNPLEWEISRRLPPRFRMAKNDVYITRKTQLAAQFNKCKTILDRKVDQLVIHALGRAINRALKLALKLEAAMLHSIKLDVQTGSVTVTDDLTSLLDGNESMSRGRQVSSVHILLTRIED